MPVVIDASIAAAWCFPDEEAPSGVDALALDLVHNIMLVPGIFWYEVRNALVRAERRGRIDLAGSSRFLEQLGELQTEMDSEHNEAQTLALARRHGLSFYDASYLEVALRRGARLATLDSAPVAAATSEGVLAPAE